MAAKVKQKMISHGIVAQNRKARHDYDIIETIEAGIVLVGAEVKSLRLGRATLPDSYAVERDNELWLLNTYIPAYQGGVFSSFDEKAPRKLLMKRKEIKKWVGEVAKAGASIVPLDIHFDRRGRAKVNLALVKGRKSYDKRRAIKDREWKRDQARVLRDKNAD